MAAKYIQILNFSNSIQNIISETREGGIISEEWRIKQEKNTPFLEEKTTDGKLIYLSSDSMNFLEGFYAKSTLFLSMEWTQLKKRPNVMVMLSSS